MTRWLPYTSALVSHLPHFRSRLQAENNPDIRRQHHWHPFDDVGGVFPFHLMIRSTYKYHNTIILYDT